MNAGKRTHWQTDQGVWGLKNPEKPYWLLMLYPKVDRARTTGSYVTYCWCPERYQEFDIEYIPDPVLQR